MKGRWIRIILFALILSETILLSFPVQAKVIVKDFEELKEVLECEQKKKIGFTVACVNEFAQQHNLSIQESFRYLFQFKGIAFIKENYEVEHTLDFGTIVEDLEMLCRKNGGVL